jgi:hypothetical protein
MESGKQLRVFVPAHFLFANWRAKLKLALFAQWEIRDGGDQSEVAAFSRPDLGQEQ